MFGGSELVKVDKAHSELVKGLVMASKPSQILELGVGGGETTDAILSGLRYNQKNVLILWLITGVIGEEKNQMKLKKHMGM